MEINLLLPIAHKSARTGKISILKLEGIIKKISYWASRLWIGRRKELILGYVSKNYKKNSGTKGLKTTFIALQDFKILTFIDAAELRFWQFYLHQTRAKSLASLPCVVSQQLVIPVFIVRHSYHVETLENFVCIYNIHLLF